jgi:hypothetical protein
MISRCWVIHFRYRRSGSSHQADHIPGHSPGPLLPDPAVHGIAICAVKLLGVSRVANIGKEGSESGYVQVLRIGNGGSKITGPSIHAWERPTDHIYCRLM